MISWRVTFELTLVRHCEPARTVAEALPIGLPLLNPDNRYPTNL